MPSGRTPPKYIAATSEQQTNAAGERDETGDKREVGEPEDLDQEGRGEETGGGGEINRERRNKIEM